MRRLPREEAPACVPAEAPTEHEKSVLAQRDDVTKEQFDKQRKTRHTLARARLNDVKKLMLERHRGTVPEGDERYAVVIAFALIVLDPGRIAGQLECWARKYFPWLVRDEFDAAFAALVKDAKFVARNLGMADAGQVLDLKWSEREWLDVRTMEATDVSAPERRRRKARKKREREARRKRDSRRAAGSRDRTKSNERVKPWEKLDISRATFYRRRAAGELQAETI